MRRNLAPNLVLPQEHGLNSTGALMELSDGSGGGGAGWGYAPWGAEAAASPAPERASCSTSHARTAHLMRIGYFTTPFRATRSPNSSSSGSTSPAIIPRKSAARCSASSTECPFTASVSMEADDCEIEHPCPWN